MSPTISLIIPITHRHPNTSHPVTALSPLSKRISTACHPLRQIHQLRHTHLLPRMQLTPPSPPLLHQPATATILLHQSTTTSNITLNQETKRPTQSHDSLQICLFPSTNATSWDTTQGPQRNRHLGVMRRRRRHDAADGDPAIGRIDVQLVPDPGGGMALGVALAADIAGPRQVCQHLRKAHRQLPFQPPRLLRPRLSLAWPPPLAPLRLRCLRLRRRLLPRLDRRRIPRDVLDKMAIHRPRNQRLMQTAARRLSANSEKARENVASLGSRPAPLQPHSRQSLPSTSRRSIRPASSECRTRPWL